MKRFDIHVVITTEGDLPSRRVSEYVNRVLGDHLPEGTTVAALVTADSLSGLMAHMLPPDGVPVVPVRKEPSHEDEK